MNNLLLSRLLLGFISSITLKRIIHIPRFIEIVTKIWVIHSEALFMCKSIKENEILLFLFWGKSFTFKDSTFEKDAEWISKKFVAVILTIEKSLLDWVKHSSSF